MPKPKDTPEELTEQMTDLTNPLSPNEVKAYQANILYRLKRARWHIDEVMKHYPTESMGSALDRLKRAQSLVAEISKDLAILTLEQTTSKQFSPHPPKKFNHQN